MVVLQGSGFEPPEVLTINGRLLTGLEQQPQCCKDRAQLMKTNDVQMKFAVVSWLTTFQKFLLC